jgi:hypothetical protein
VQNSGTELPENGRRWSCEFWVITQRRFPSVLDQRFGTLKMGQIFGSETLVKNRRKATLSNNPKVIKATPAEASNHINGGRCFLRNVRIYQTDYTVSQSWRLRSASSLPQKFKTRQTLFGIRDVISPEMELTRCAEGECDGVLNLF